MALSNTEQWLPVKDFSNYEVSDSGKIRNVKTRRALKPRNGHEYPSVALYNQSGRSDKLIHRVVAETFYGGGHDGMDVNHIDGNKANNRLDNLEFCTRSDNLRHAFANGLKEPSCEHDIVKVRIVETGDVYNSARECARAIHGSQGHISRCLNGIYKQYRGYHFERIDENNERGD